MLNPVTLADHSTALVFLYFVPAERSLPVGGIRPDTEASVVFDMFLPLDDYPSIIDLLRNEGPLEFCFDDTNPEGWHLRTRQEPVGEGENTTPNNG